MKKLVGVALCLPMVVLAIVWVVFAIGFNIHCGGHMTRAGTANSIELARQEMETVVKYAEANGMTSGYTSIFLNTPADDVGFWYSNMKSSLDELRNVSPEASSLEKSNVLMKLRESMAHHAKEGSKLTVPDGIEVFPHNIAFVVMFVVFACLLGAALPFLLS